MDSYSSLTEREKEILLQLSIGATNKEIADILCITENTVKTHVNNILNKLGVQNRHQAALYMMRNNIDELYESVKKLSRIIDSLQSTDSNKPLE